MKRLVIVRGSEVIEGVHMGKRVHAELGTATVHTSPTESSSSRVLERLDGYKRLPPGLYTGKSVVMDNNLYAIRLLNAVRLETPMTIAVADSFKRGRFLVHSATVPNHVQGCLGLMDAPRMWRGLGLLAPDDTGELKWTNGIEVEIEVRRGG